jgi:pimeloyl-ACP methyl ester carboxylesterase
MRVQAHRLRARQRGEVVLDAPPLAATHRVFAVDLRGFGDSDTAPGDYDSGATVFRLAATHPDDVRSLTAIETSLPGFGWERLADVARSGAWHIGLLAAPGIPG